MSKIRFFDVCKDPAGAASAALLENCPDRTRAVDLSGILFILPGRQAIRAVSANLADHASLVIPPTFVTGGSFQHLGASDGRMMSPAEKKAVWMQILEQIDAARYPALFPNGLRKDSDEISYFSDQILALHNELEISADFGSVESAGAVLGKDDARWSELTELERRFRKAAEAYGFPDPVSLSEDHGRETDFFLKYKRIIAAFSPDLSPRAKRKLSRLNESFYALKDMDAPVPEIEVWINARESDSAMFDEWGCVRPDVWCDYELDFGKGQNRIHSVQSPEEMAQLAFRLSIDPDRNVFDAEKTALVVTDPGFFPDLEQKFSRFRREDGSRLSIYDPNGVPMGRLRITALLASLRALISGDHASADSVKGLLRQEWFLRYASRETGMTSDEILTTADHYFTVRLPDEIREENLPDSKMTGYYCRNYSGENEEKQRMSGLRKLFQRLLNLRADLKMAKDPLTGVRSILKTVFPAESTPDRFGISLSREANRFRSTAEEFANSPILSKLPLDRLLFLLEETLSGERLYTGHKADALEIIGFLDMPFRTAERGILCGMNEGLLPEAIAPTPFLNDSIRAKLGLPDNASRYARDCYYLKTLLDRTDGNIHFISCRTGSDGSPMRFSSLYFSAVKDPDVLLERTAVLFEPYQLSQETVQPDRTLPFHAEADLSHAFLREDEIVLNVTDFKELLTSPLRAFFNRDLKMTPQDYAFPELDAAALGTIVHRVLQNFELKEEWLAGAGGTNEMLRNQACQDAFDEFYRRFLGEIALRVGNVFPLLPMIQSERWVPRIRQMVRELLTSSFPVLECEWKLGGGEGIPFHGIRIKGTIDRIEYDPDRRVLRLIDFKTVKDAENPKSAHVNTKRFFNLQLPLYKLLLQNDACFQKKYPAISMKDCRIQCGYFSISSVVADIGYKSWDDMDLYDDAAEKTAVQIIELVKAMQEGRLQENLSRSFQYDAYEALFPQGLDAAFGASLQLEDPPTPVEMPNAKKGVRK